MMGKSRVFLKLKDFSVSGESFELIYNEDLDLLETYPQPKDEVLTQYYKSEDYISHTDSKRNLFEKLYQSVKRITLKDKLNIISGYVNSSKNLLDIGCGTGDFLKYAQSNKWNVTGIEPNTDARNIANSKTNNNVFDTKELQSLKKNSFDVITLWHVLEHLPNLDEHIALFKSLLKKEGVLIIAVPNYKSLDAKYYKQYWAAYDVPRHLWHFSKTSIVKLFNNYSFNLIKTKPMWFDAFYVCLLSEKYKVGFMHFFRAFLIAFISNVKALFFGNFSSQIYILKQKN